MAVLSGSLAAVKMIVEKTGRACLELRDAHNRTPLILATIGGHGELVNYLLSVGGQSLARQLTHLHRSTYKMALKIFYTVV